jgi:hypothetical protein
VLNFSISSKAHTYPRVWFDSQDSRTLRSVQNLCRIHCLTLLTNSFNTFDPIELSRSIRQELATAQYVRLGLDLHALKGRIIPPNRADAIIDEGKIIMDIRPFERFVKFLELPARQVLQLRCAGQETTVPRSTSPPLTSVGLTQRCYFPRTLHSN